MSVIAMPRFQSLLCRMLAPAFLLALAPSVVAGENNNERVRDRVRERVLRMTEFFDTMLPGVLEERNITFHFKPKFSDLRDNEFMRFPMELRYGYSNHLELAAGIVPFTPSPFNGGRDHRWGPGEAKLGARYDVGPTLGFFDDTTFGLETRVPLGKPPLELNDRYTHVKPSISAARKLLVWPNTTFYANVSYDRTVKLTDRTPPPPEVTRRHIIEVAPGLLFKPSELGYFAEYRWRHFAEPTGWHLGHEVQFGTIWDVPLARSEKWRLPGKWQLELGYKLTLEEGRDEDHGIRARVNWRTSLREVLNHANGKAAKNP
jgi:hypothetical protein